MRRVRKLVLLVASILLYGSVALTFSEGGRIVKVEGVVMAIDLAKRIVIVNERAFLIDNKTAIYDENGKPVSLRKLNLGERVYIEGTRDERSNKNTATRICFIPKRSYEKTRQPYFLIQ